MSLEVGQPAPEFTLAATGDVEKISLHDLRGQKVVLLFNVGAWSSVCTTEFCGIRDDYQSYKDLGARVLGISVDTPWTLKAWAKAENIPFPLLSDFNKEVSAAYGALYEKLGELKGISKRSAFVIDSQGVVRYRWVSEDPKVIPPLDEVKEAVRTAE